MTRQELITSREYWVGKIHLNLWAANGSIEADSDKWEEMAEKVVDADFMALLKEVEQSRQADVSCWVAFDWMKIETRPTEYGKYLICRKDGKIHWETWNGSGWAYNHNEIRFWAVIVPPCS